MRDRKTRPTELRNGLPYEIDIEIECKYHGKWSHPLKHKKAIYIIPLGYSKQATLSFTLKGYLGKNWTYQRNLRTLIDPKEQYTPCLFVSGDDAEQEQINLFYLQECHG